MSKKKKPVFDLDAEEKSISNSFDRGEWESVDNLKKKKNRKHVWQRRIISVKVRASILEFQKLTWKHIKRLAAFEGLPYQTLIASVLHKYAAGHPNK